MKKNYYSILGISEDEKKLKGKDFEKVVKPKFRKLAMEFHPDKQQGKSESEKKAAEEKFKEVQEAYEVLTNEEKRAKYDNPSMGGNMGFDFEGFGMNMDDIMSHFGGFDMHFNHRARTPKGQSQRINIGITLMEALNGGKKTIKYKRYDKCHICNGSGATKESKVETCPHCGGTGQIFRQDGAWQQISTCPHCKGKGTILTHPCHECKGNGVVLTETVLNVDIPKGVGTDFQQVIKGMGNAPLNCNGEYGDLIINFYDIKDDKFERYGDTVTCKIEVNVIDALLGCNKEIETIDGKKILTKIPNGVEDGVQLRFNGKGLPHYDNNNIIGPMIGIIKLVVPKDLSEKEIELLKELQQSKSFK